MARPSAPEIPPAARQLAARLHAAVGTRGPGARTELATVTEALKVAATSWRPGSYERGALDGLLALADVASQESRRSPLPAQRETIEPGSLAERLLLEIASGVRGANADLADRLHTDAWQLSRAGRRLRECGYATCERAGRLNVWALTPEGAREADRRRG